MNEMLLEILCEFKKAEYKIHVLHTSMQGMMFLQYHGFLDEIYNFIGDQIDEIMEMMEQLGFNVPVNFEEITKEEKDDKESVIELKDQVPSIEEQLHLVENTLMTLKDCLQTGIITAGSAQDFVVQNNLIDYQKAIRKMERKNRRVMGQK